MREYKSAATEPSIVLNVDNVRGIPAEILKVVQGESARRLHCGSWWRISGLDDVVSLFCQDV